MLVTKLVSGSVLVFLISCVGVLAQKTVEVRLSPTEIEAITSIAAGAGTSGLSGIKTRVLKGDPNSAGLYTIQLSVPANTRIEAHDHPDDRVATVVSGTWYIGFGEKFDETKLKALSPGSFYTEPPGKMHFARTGKQPVVIVITGIGPTGTKYSENKANNGVQK